MQRIYIVHDKQADTQRLVMAVNPAQALRFVANDRFDVSSANAVKVAELMSKGTVVEKTSDAEDQLELAEAE